METIGKIIRDLEKDWTTGTVQTSEYVSQNFYEDLNTIDAYLNSIHISGKYDSLEREKPFFNIVLAARNIWFRATDLDRKNIRAKANKSKDYLAEFLYTIYVQNWMNQTNFGEFLNNWGIQLASYNSIICKFVDNSDGLHSIVVPWNNIMCDVIDFDSNPKVEKLELTPAQLRQNKSYDQDLVEKLIKEQTARTLPNNQQKDLKSNFIKLYEIHGNLPLSYLTGEEKDETTYVQQMQVVSTSASKENGKFDDFVLYKGREAKDPYMLTWLFPSTDGSISLNGSVKNLFEAQWMINTTQKNIKDILDFTSKMVLQTADATLANKNVLNDLELGQIITYDAQKDPNGLQVVNTSEYGYQNVVSLQNLGNQWKNLAQEIDSTPDIMGGTNMPSGTAWRQASIIQKEAYSNFEIMTENKGLHLEQMFRKYITPYLIKKMNNKEELVATLEDYGIDKIEEVYISNKAIQEFNKKAVKAVLNDTKLPNLEEEKAKIQQQFAGKGTRFIKPSEISSKTWKDIMGDFKGDVIYEITGENTEKQAVLDTLVTVLQTLSSNPTVLQDPNAKMVFSEILNETGKISPLKIKEAQTQSIQNQPAMVGAGKEMNNLKQ